MKITSQQQEGVAILRMDGRFDAHEVAEVRKALDNARSQGSSRIVLTLSGVNFIDSSGLACLVQGMKHCRDAGGDLVLCEMRQPLRIIFELTRLDRAFQLFGREAEAVQAFAALRAER